MIRRYTAETSVMVAEILKRHRRRMNVSQERLAHMADVDRTYVGKVERGILNPTLARFDRLLGAMGVTWKDFGESLDTELAKQLAGSPPHPRS